MGCWEAFDEDEGKGFDGGPSDLCQDCFDKMSPADRASIAVFRSFMAVVERNQPDFFKESRN